MSNASDIAKFDHNGNPIYSGVGIALLTNATNTAVSNTLMLRNSNDVVSFQNASTVRI